MKTGVLNCSGTGGTNFFNPLSSAIVERPMVFISSISDCERFKVPERHSFKSFFPSECRHRAVIGYPASPCTLYIAMANTAASFRPAASAAPCIVSAATIPPVSGGSPDITRALSIMRGQMNQHRATMPTRPTRHTTTVFHCSMSCFKLITVPMCVMNIKTPMVLAKGASPESAATVFGITVQKPMRKIIAVTNTDGTHARVKVDTHSPIT